MRWADLHGRGRTAGAARRGGALRPLAALHLCGGHLQRRLSGPAGGGAVPELFDGGVDWEGTDVDARGPNLLTDLPPGILNYPDYAASGFDPDSTAAKNIRAAGYPPDLVAATTLARGPTIGRRSGRSPSASGRSGWTRPTTPTVRAPAPTTTYARLSVSDVGAQVASFATSGDIQRPLLTVAGTMDGAAADRPARARLRPEGRGGPDDRDDDGHGWGRHRHDRRPDYRLYEVQNGNHIETYKLTLPAARVHRAARAAGVRSAGPARRAPRALPPSQCIPRGGSISASPAQPGHCAPCSRPERPAGRHSWVSGSSTRNSVPRSLSEWASSMLPPCASAMARAMKRPSPDPRCRVPGGCGAR